MAVVVRVVAVVLAAAAIKYMTGEDTESAGAGSASEAGVAPAGPAAPPAVSGAAAEIPPSYLALYQQSGGTCPNLDWALLAGIGKVETNHGRVNLPGVHSGANFAGARGPMQFLATTYASVRRRHPEVGPNVYDPAHAIPAAAHLLCDNGVRDGRVYQAVWGYNHADWYVRKVLKQAAAYR